MRTEEGQSAWTLRRTPGGWTAVDLAVALGLLLLLVTEIAPNPEMTPHAPLVALAAAMTAPFAWRAAHPVTVALAVSVLHLAMSVVASGPFAPQLAVVPLLVALFSGAAGSRGRTSAAVGATTLALGVAAWILSEEGHVDDFWPWLLWAGAWASGTFVRRRGDAAAHHARRAALLEVEARATASESAQQERDRIARELHDVVAHSVSVMVVQAGAERLRLGPRAGHTGEVLEAIEESGRSALAELRSMLGVMRDPSGQDVAPLPSLRSIPALVDHLRGAGVEVDLTARPAGLLTAEDPRLAAPGLAAYRIVQEALTNVVRHAGGVPTRVVITGDADRLDVRVSNGPAARQPRPVDGAGWGLFGMRERAAALGGRCRAGEAADGGFEVEAVLPLRPEHAR